MSFIASILTKVQASEKEVPAKQVRSDRAAIINHLCDTRGSEYRGLKQYRSL